MAENTRKQKIHDLPITYGSFNIKGKVRGTDGDRFFKELQTKSKKNMRVVEFGVVYDKKDGNDLSRFFKLMGVENDKVFVSKIGADKNDPNRNTSVPWSQRHGIDQKEYRINGVNLGLTKTTDEKGHVHNLNKRYVNFDACQEIKENLKEKASVFVKGNIVISTNYAEDGKVYKKVELDPNQISLMSAEINFEDEEFEPTNDFKQTVVFQSISEEKDLDGKPTGKFVLLGLVVKKDAIEEMEFIVEDKRLAMQFKKAFKPYWSLDLYGKLVCEVQAEEVKPDEIWGSLNSMKKVKAPAKYYFLVTGTSVDSFDKDTYSEAKIEEAKEAISRSKQVEKDFGKQEVASAFEEGISDDWGSFTFDESAWD